MKHNIGYRIRKLRESKDYSQQNMADELGLTHSAYSKIETGKTDPSVGRVKQIAEILKVDVLHFFQEEVPAKVGERDALYGAATKSELEDVIRMIDKLKEDIAFLKANLPAPAKRKKT